MHSVRYRVCRIAGGPWSSWKRASKVIRGLGWTKFDDALFDSAWAWECKQDLPDELPGRLVRRY